MLNVVLEVRVLEVVVLVVVAFGRKTLVDEEQQDSATWKTTQSTGRERICGNLQKTCSGAGGE